MTDLYSSSPTVYRVLNVGEQRHTILWRCAYDIKWNNGVRGNDPCHCLRGAYVDRMARRTGHHREQDVSPDNVMWLVSTFWTSLHTEEAKLHWIGRAEPTRPFARNHTMSENITALSIFFWMKLADDWLIWCMQHACWYFQAGQMDVSSCSCRGRRSLYPDQFKRMVRRITRLEIRRLSRRRFWQSANDLSCICHGRCAGCLRCLSELSSQTCSQMEESPADIYTSSFLPLNRLMEVYLNRFDNDPYDLSKSWSRALLMSRETRASSITR